MINDPIVEEIRQIRERLFAEADYDLAKYVETLRKSQLEHPERIVTLEEVRRRREERKQREGKN